MTNPLVLYALQTTPGVPSHFNLKKSVALFLSINDHNCMEYIGNTIINPYQFICTWLPALSIILNVIILLHNIRKTVELVKRAEVAGASWITVHGRTVNQRTEPNNIEAIKTVSKWMELHILFVHEILCTESTYTYM